MANVIQQKNTHKNNILIIALNLNSFKNRFFFYLRNYSI